jgi:hypothetical protein
MTTISMGNNININIKNNKFKDFFTGIDEETIVYLRNNYKIIDVDYLDPILVHSKIFNHEQFTQKNDVIDKMLKYYLNHRDSEIYKKTDYLCNEKEKVCICNTHADDLRKIYDGINYKPNEKYISWFKL